MSIGIVVEAIVLNLVWAFELKVYPFFVFMDVNVGPLGFHVWLQVGHVPRNLSAVGGAAC